MQPAVRRERADHRVPIELRVDGADQEVKVASELPDRRRVFGRDGVVRPEALRLIELALARRERCHVVAARGGELHGHVTETADADDADPVDRLGVHDQRREDGDAPAEEWPGVGEVQRFRQREDPRPAWAVVDRDPAAMTDDGWLHLWAKMMASRHALATMHATAREPADADALSDRESLGVRSDGRDTTDDLMAENRGVLRDSPLIVQDGE